MASLIGNDGAFTFSGGGGGTINRWTCTFTRVVSDVTPFSQATYARARGGLFTISGSCSGAPEGTSANDPDVESMTAAGESIVFTVNTTTTTNTISLDAVCSGVSFESNKNGDAVILFDWVGGDVDNTTAFAWT